MALESAGDSSPAAQRAGVIPLALRSKMELYQAWMPFLQGGGLFVPSARAHVLGEEVFLLLTYLQEPTKVTLRGTVAWINPAHTSGGRPQGIGVKVASDPVWDELRKQIETLLAGVVGSARPTHTI